MITDVNLTMSKILGHEVLNYTIPIPTNKCAKKNLRIQIWNLQEYSEFEKTSKGIISFVTFVKCVPCCRPADS